MSKNGKLTWINETRKLSELIPWPRNPRQVKVDQVRRLQESLDEFGQVDVIAISPENEIYNGHQRLKSWADKFGDIDVDVRVSNRALTEKEREKLTVFLHKGAAGEWDFDILANEFEVDDLLDWGFDEHELDLDLWGVEPEEDPGAQIDRAEELREKWGVSTGQLWKLGEHRLICGDCTDAEVVERVMDGEKAQTTFTDPPYNVGKNYGSDVDDTRMDYREWCGIWFNLCLSECIVFTPGTVNLFMWLHEFQKPKWVCIWRKINQQSPSGLNGYNTWEPLLVYGKNPKPVGQDLWDIPVSISEDLAHIVPKTLNAWEVFLEAFSTDLAIIYDPFLGSGTTLIACERLNRKCRAIEISPSYCAVAIQRWVDMTSGEPELISEE